MTVDTLTAVYKAEVQDFLRGTSKVNQQFKGMRHISVWSMSQMGRAVAQAGRAVLGFAGDVVKSGMEFEQSIANMRSVLPQADQFGETFEALTAKVQELGATTTFTASEAAEAAQFLAMAGLSAKQTLDALPATLQLASAGSLELGKAADIATNVMTGFGMGAQELQRIVDTLAYTAANSNTNIRGLGQSFSFVAATANGLGVSIESASAGIAALGNAGIQAGRAGRNLSGLLAELAKKGKGLGLDIFEANGELKDLSGILAAVEKAGLSTSDIIDKFGKISSRTLIALMQTGSEKMAEFEGKVRATGVTLEHLTNIASAAGKDFDKLSAAFEGSQKTAEVLGVTTTDTTTLLLQLADAGIEGEQASDLFKKGLSQLADGARAAGVDIFKTNGDLQNFNVVLQDLGIEGKTTQELIETFGAEGAKVIEVLAKDGGKNFEELSKKVKEFAGSAEGAGSAMQEMKVDTLEGDLKLLTSAFDGLKQAITGSGLNDVIRQIVQGITSLVNEATEFVNQNKEAINEFFTELSTKIGPAVAQLRPHVIPVLTAIAESFVETSARVIEFVSNMLNNKDTLASVFSGISQAVRMLREVIFGLLESFAAMPAPMQKFVIGAAAISVVFGPLLTLVLGFSSGLMALTRAFIPATTGATGLKAIFGSLLSPVGLVTAAVIGLTAAFATNFGGIRDKVIETWNKIIAKFGDGERKFEGFRFFLQALWASFEQVFEIVADLVVDALSVVVTAIINAGKVIGDVFNMIGALLQGDFAGAWKATKDLMANIVAFLVDLFAGLGTTFLNLGENIVKGLGEGITNAFNSARETVENLANNIINWFKGILGIQSPSTVFADFGMQIVQGLINGLSGMVESARARVVEFANNISGWFKNVLGIRSPSLEFLKAGNDIVQGLVDGIHAKQGEASKAAKELAQKTQEAFNLQMQALRTNLELGIIDPQDAKKALVELGNVLQAEMQRLEDTGKTGTAAFIEIAKASKQVEAEIKNVDKAIADAIKQTHGITEATTTWLNKLKSQADLGLRPLVEIYNELEKKATEVFAKIEELQDGGLTDDELPIFEALVEKHEAIVNVLDSVEGKMLEADKLEEELAQKAIERGASTLQERINQIQQRLNTEKLSKEQIELLEEQLADNTKTFNEQKKAHDQAYFEFRKAQGLASRDEELARIQAEIDAAQEGSAERVAAERKFWETKQGFQQQDLDFQAAQIELLKTQGQNVLQEELKLAQARLAIVQEGTAEYTRAYAAVVAAEEAINQERLALDDKYFELARAKGEANLQDELNRERAKLAEFKEDNQERVEQLTKIANLEKQLAQEQSQARKDAFAAAKEDSAAATEALVAELEARLAVFRGSAAEEKALEEDLKVFRKEASELRQKEAEEGHRHKLALGKISLQQHEIWLREQLAASKGNVEETRKLELELKRVTEEIRKNTFDALKKLAKELTEKQREEAKEQQRIEEAVNKLLFKIRKAQAEKAKQLLKEKNDFVEEVEKETAEKQKRIAKELHDHGIQLSQRGLRAYISTLESRLAELAEKGQQESDEYKLIQKRITEADELFHERRVDLAVKEAEQKLAQAEITKDEYVAKLQQIMTSEGISVKDRIDLAKQLADFKRSEFKVLSEDEIQFLENIWAKEQLTADEIEKLTDALTDIIKDNAEEREEAHKTADENAEAHAKKTSEEIKQTWERDTKAIAKALFEVSDSLKDISPVAAGVFDFVGNLANGVAANIGKIKDGSFGAADALQVIGSAAQASSSIAVSALGGVVNAIGQIASGNIVGGIASGVSTVVGFIGGLFSRSSKAAKKAREEARKFREEMEKLQQDVKDWASSLGESLNETFVGIDVGDFIKVTLGADIDDGKGFLDDFARGLVENILKARAKVADALANISDNFDVSDVFSIETGEITDEGLKIVGEISQFAGRYVTAIEGIQQKMLEGTNRISAEARAALDRQLGEAIGNFEEWITSFEEAAGFLKSGFSDGLSSIFVDGEPFKNAAKALSDNFRKHVIESMFSMAIEASGATALIAAGMADLQVLLKEAFTAEDFDFSRLRTAVADLAREVTSEFEKVATVVGGALDEVFDDLDTGTAKVDVATNTDTGELDANVKVELDKESVQDFTEGVKQLTPFAEMWSEGITNLGEFISSFALSTQQLEQQFLPNLDTGIGTFSGASNTFKDSVGIFDAGVKTFDSSVVQDTTNKQEFNRKLNLFADRLEGIFNEDAFARLRS